MRLRPLQPPPVPDYLRIHYGWAYIHPRAVKLFERQWLINLILWGQYRRLRNAALCALGKPVRGRTLQVACAYGDLTPELVHLLDAQATLDVIDVVPAQLVNLRAKLPNDRRVHLHQMDSTALEFRTASFDQVLLFFLLHEQPPKVRERTLNEALRVLRPGGLLVVVDYSRSVWWNPLRWIWAPLIRRLEPFANDLFEKGLEALIWGNPGLSRVMHRRCLGDTFSVLASRRLPS